MSISITGQVVGCLAVLFSLAGYQINKRKNILLVLTVGSFLYSVAFLLLHAYTGAALNLLAAIRCYSFTRTATRRGSIQTFLLFSIASMVATALTWDGPTSLLALAGTLLYALSEGQLRTKSLRRMGLFAPPAWFCYNFLTGFYPGMFIEALMIVSNIVGQYRFDLKQKPNRQRNRAMP